LNPLLRATAAEVVVPCQGSCLLHRGVRLARDRIIGETAGQLGRAEDGRQHGRADERCVRCGSIRVTMRQAKTSLGGIVYPHFLSAQGRGSSKQQPDIPSGPCLLACSSCLWLRDREIGRGTHLQTHTHTHKHQTATNPPARLLHTYKTTATCAHNLIILKRGEGQDCTYLCVKAFKGSCPWLTVVSITVLCWS